MIATWCETLYPRIAGGSLAFVVLVLFLSGCAFGHKVSYTEAIPRIVVSGTNSVGVAVHDQRKRSPAFVGETRSLYHIPYGVYTASGKPLAEDLTTVLVTSFSSKGFIPLAAVTVDSDSPDEVVRKVVRLKVDRGVVLTLLDWRTDTYFKTQLFYDLRLKVIDPGGTVLAQHQVSGHEDELGSTHPSTALQTRLERLLDDPEVAQALAMKQTPAAATPVVSPAPTPTPPAPLPQASQQWRVFSYAPGMTDRTALAEPAPTVEACRLLRNALEPYHSGRILACEVTAP